MSRLIEEYPFPNKAMLLIMDLYRDGKITKEQCEILNFALTNYMQLRRDFIDGR